MKSKIIEKDVNNGSEYPKLMVIKEGKLDVGTVVLMTANGEGFVVHPTGIQCIGYNSDSWNMFVFEDFHGTIELSN